MGMQPAVDNPLMPNDSDGADFHVFRYTNQGSFLSTALKVVRNNSQVYTPSGFVGKSTGTFTMSGTVPSIAQVVDDAVETNSVILVSVKSPSGTNVGKVRIFPVYLGAFDIINVDGGDASEYSYIVLN
jgi:hypothetical protein